MPMPTCSFCACNHACSHHCKFHPKILSSCPILVIMRGLQDQRQYKQFVCVCFFFYRKQFFNSKNMFNKILIKIIYSENKLFLITIL